MIGDRTTEEAPVREQRGPTVLVVDDDAATRRLLERVLDADGLRCVIAKDGEEGVQLAHATRPDLIVMDISMPKLDGLSALRKIRGSHRLATTPVIFLTGDTGIDSLVDHLGAGADDYLVKPVRAREFIARVRLALRRVESLRDLNPLTLLPGNGAIMREIQQRLGHGEALAFLHVDLDNFKAFNDHYGFARGDRAIRKLADLLNSSLEAVPSERHFAGHIGGDDFVVLTIPELCEPVATEITTQFDSEAPFLYRPSDRVRGWIDVRDRRGRSRRTPLMSVSIGIARTDQRPLDSPARIASVASEMKAVAKREPGSAWAVDRRR